MTTWTACFKDREKDFPISKRLWRQYQANEKRLNDGDTPWNYVRFQRDDPGHIDPWDRHTLIDIVKQDPDLSRMYEVKAGLIYDRTTCLKSILRSNIHIIHVVFQYEERTNSS